MLSQENSPRRNNPLRTDIVICLLLMATTFCVYCRTVGYEFVRFDDPEYVYENPAVREGLSRQSFVWAFTSFQASNWHPLTWLSLMLDRQVGGTRPGWFHMTNVLLHLANTLLLYFFFKKTAVGAWQSGFAAALFALHPLHVESVAWVTERKDVLSTLFWLLTMLGYIRYAECRSGFWYAATLVFYACGLMAKPMLVSLPFVLLLLDWWPLGRLKFQLSAVPQSKTQNNQRTTINGQLSTNDEPRAANYGLFIEKLPLFALAVASCVITYIVQLKGGALSDLIEYPLSVRLSNALITYADYLWKMVWPSGLAMLYPFPEAQPWWEIAASGVLLAGITLGAIKAARAHGYVLFGWLWYLGTLMPVIGLVQIGKHAMADRYTYVPLIGIFLIIARGVPEAIAGLRFRKIILAGAGSMVLAALMVMTWAQVGYWKNTRTLFEHTLSVTENNFVIHNNLGIELSRLGNSAEAIAHLTEAIRINPSYPTPYYNIAIAFSRQGKYSESVRYFEITLKLSPDKIDAHDNFGIALLHLGRTAEAIAQFQAALRLWPGDPLAQSNLQKALPAHDLQNRGAENRSER